jgi:glycosyltransferase involved in cell wall biosynthesis
MLPLDMPDEFNVLKRTFLRRPSLGSIEQADTLLCVSEATRDRMTEYVPMARERSMVVPLAASSSLLGATAEPVPELVQREFAFVVGDPSRRKNIALLVDLWPDVVRRRPGAVLAIVGPPSWGPSSLGRFHGQLTEQGQIASLGYVNDAELRWCYEHATVVLCPSRAEGFGLPAVEALAFGAPLITSDDAALCEVSGNAALHLPASDRRQWLEAIVTALMAGRVTNVAASVRPRAWKDVAAETVAAVRHPA